MTPTQRSLAHLRKSWPLVAVVERWNPHAKIRQDLFGFIDIICFRENEVLAVQCTSDGNVSARVQKILAAPAAAVWLQSQTRKIVVHGWAKKGPRGKRKVWTMREIEVLSIIEPKEAV